MKFRLISLSLLSFFYLHETDACLLSINPQVHHRSQSSNLLLSTALDNWHPVRLNGTPFAPERPRDAWRVGKSVFALEMHFPDCTDCDLLKSECQRVSVSEREHQTNRVAMLLF